MSKLFVKFTAFDFVIMALMAAIGVAIKPVVVTLSHIITGPLFLPGGVVAGGIYMGFIVLGAAMVNKPGAATIIALVQALLVTVTGVFGTHGAVSLLTYTIPGLLIDGLWLAMGHYGCCLLCCFLGGMVANIGGSFLVNLTFFRLPLVPLLLMIVVSAISGGVGGIVAWNIKKVLVKYHLVGRSAYKVQAAKAEGENEEKH